MKNVQAIDCAENCTFPIFQVSDDEFHLIFSGDGQDIEFFEDFSQRVGHKAAGKILAKIWERPILKSAISGLHGTLFFKYGNRRKYFPISKKECDFSEKMLNEHQRAMYSGVEYKKCGAC